jgi:hypothetical protein
VEHRLWGTLLGPEGVAVWLLVLGPVRVCVPVLQGSSSRRTSFAPGFVVVGWGLAWGCGGCLPVA